jgi:hypothetical protein
LNKIDELEHSILIIKTTNDEVIIIGGVDERK